jgi:hypothetical protein
MTNVKKIALIFLFFTTLSYAADESVKVLCEGKLVNIFGENYKTQKICTAKLNKESVIVGILYINDNENVLLKNNADVPHCEMSGNSHLFVSGGVSISHLWLRDNSSVKIEQKSDISHISLYGKSKAVINGGNISFLNLNDDAVAHIYGINIEGGHYSAGNVNIKGGAVTYSPNSTIHIYADNVVFEGGKLSGLWQDGRHFSFWLIEKKPTKRYKYNSFDHEHHSSIPTQMPKQIIIHKAERF